MSQASPPLWEMISFKQGNKESLALLFSVPTLHSNSKIAPHKDVDRRKKFLTFSKQDANVATTAQGFRHPSSHPSQRHAPGPRQQLLE